MTTPQFDLSGPLPAGRLRLEASAGTGKTYTVSRLVTRFVVERGLPIGQLLVTTFTRAAAQELRERIRKELAELAPRHAEARTAVADFDSATIGTIHGICHRILQLTGRPVQLEDRPGRHEALVAEVVNDLLVQQALMGGAVDADEQDLAAFVRRALANPMAQRIPDPHGEDPRAPLMALVDRAVAEVRERSRAQVSFDGLLLAAHDAVTGPGGPALCAKVAARHPVAIVDEAQDTDPVQWGIFDTLYPATDPSRTLVVVGDPKQSIYAFRGADVASYRLAGEGAETQTLAVNYRSDQPLLDALNVLMQDARFGAGIAYHPVNACADNQRRKAPVGVPVVELVVAGGEDSAGGEADRLLDDPAPDSPTPMASAAALRVHCALAEGSWGPEEVAVLVGTRAEGAMVADALRARGIPCTTAGTSSVAREDAARELRALLRGLVRPGDGAVGRLVATGWFGNRARAELPNLADDDLLATQEQLRELGPRVRRLGIASVLHDLAGRAPVLERLTAAGSLARHLTDLDHLAELLHERTGRRGCTPDQALAALLELERMDEKADLVTRRLDTDAKVVQVMTIHVAKGLQFPVVVVARKWGDMAPNRDAPVVRRPEDGRPVLDGGWLAKPFAPGVPEAEREAWHEEQKRLLYVALTRAKHQLVVVLPAEKVGARHASVPGQVFGVASPITSADALRDALRERLAPLGDTVRITALAEVMREAPAVHAAPPAPPPVALAVAPLPAPVIRVPREWSFTSISARGAHEPDAVVVAEQGGLDEHGAVDEPALEREGTDAEAKAATDAAAGQAAPPAPGPLADLPASAEVGVCLHAVFERADFTAPDLDAELRPLLARHAAVPALRDRHDALAGGLARVIDTPLGAGVPGNPALRQLARPHRLDELRFQLALAPRGRGAAIRKLGALWADALATTDPLRPYARTLADGALTAWPTGYLVGAIDLVARLPLAAADGQDTRYLVIDYKSNRLRDGYHHAALTRAMMAHHYPLQGLLYLVAVHRFLRWRTGVADPSPQLAGFAYLFVRGMLGPDTPVDAAGRVQGVFHWSPPAGLVAEASALLAGGAAREVA
jgi:exodeoxyribonuclease V beta subunit